MSPELVAAFTASREQTSYAKSSDWVFASPVSFGKLPHWAEMLLRRHILPAAKLYAQAVTEDKPEAQNGLASLIMGTQNQNVQTRVAE